MGNQIFLRWICWGVFFLWIEDSCVRDSKSDVYVGVLFCYISVGCGIVMYVGDVELVLVYLY